MGIHAAGDDSHHWNWYQQQVIGAKFFHHPSDHELASDLPVRWEREEEWYVFSTNPRDSDADVLYTLDESLMNFSYWYETN